MSAVDFAAIKAALQAWVVSGSGLAATSVIWEGQDAPRPAAPYVSMRLDVAPVGFDWVARGKTPLVVPATAFTADPLTDVLAATAHGLSTGDGPVRPSTTGSLPAPLTTTTDCWAIRVDADHLQLAATFLDARAGTAIDLTDAGTGTHSFASTAATLRAGAEITHRARGTRRCTLALQAFAAESSTGSAAQYLTDVAAAVRLPSVASALRAAGAGTPMCGAIQVVGGGKLNYVVFEPRAVMECVFFAASEVTETGTIVDRLLLVDGLTGGTLTVSEE